MIKSFFSKILEKKHVVTAEKRLENIIDFTNEILKRESKSPSAETAIYALIRMFADKIIIQNTIDVMSEFKTKIVGEKVSLSFESLMSKDYKAIHQLMWDSEYRTPVKTFTGDIVIDLAKDPVITSVWERTRLYWNIADIGKLDNPWKQQPINHGIHLYLPIGLSIVTGGNHSITCGMIKRTGKLVINESTLLCHVFDISNLIRTIKFDGKHYRMISDGSVAFEGANFDFGCIFEIGRMILDNNISFPSVGTVDIDPQ